MKTQNVLKGIRLMTFIMVIGFLTSGLYGMNEEDKLAKSGGGKTEKTEKTTTEEVQLEDWMLEMENFTVEGNKAYSLDWVNTSETEQEIKLEGWMLDYDYFMTREYKEMNQIEDWMLDNEHFRVNKNDESDRLEDWMTDSDFWKINS